MDGTYTIVVPNAHACQKLLLRLSCLQSQKHEWFLTNAPIYKNHSCVWSFVLLPDSGSCVLVQALLKFRVQRLIAVLGRSLHLVLNVPHVHCMLGRGTANSNMITLLSHSIDSHQNLSAETKEEDMISWPQLWKGKMLAPHLCWTPIFETLWNLYSLLS